MNLSEYIEIYLKNLLFSGGATDLVSRSFHA